MNSANKIGKVVFGFNIHVVLIVVVLFVCFFLFLFFIILLCILLFISLFIFCSSCFRNASLFSGIYIFFKCPNLPMFNACQRMYKCHLGSLLFHLPEKLGPLMSQDCLVWKGNLRYLPVFDHCSSYRKAVQSAQAIVFNPVVDCDPPKYA